MGGLPSDSPLGHQDTISLLAEFISTVRLTLALTLQLTLIVTLTLALTLELTRSLALALTLIVTLTLALMPALVFFRTSSLSCSSKFEDSSWWLGQDSRMVART